MAAEASSRRGSSSAVAHLFSVRAQGCRWRRVMPSLVPRQPVEAEAMEFPDTAAAYPSSPLSPSTGTRHPDEPPRVKFLCSFGGSILPRPLDGKLRYAGGETRIVSVRRDVSYEELMARVRELFDGAWALKYQQPDEDLDTLITVVNDDDVTNMMEEYDKLGAGGDGFTRLRIFVFSRPDESSASPASVAGVSHFDSADERETERRYVDALNGLSDGKTQLLSDAPVVGSVVNDTRIHPGDNQFRHRVMDAAVIHDHINLRHLNIPRQPSVAQRFNEVDGPWSPVYNSPAAQVVHDKDLSSPSSRRYHPVFEEFNDRILDEYVVQGSQQPQQYEHHPPFVESLVWLPLGGLIREKEGFPGNLGHIHSSYESSSVCEHCQKTVQTNNPDAWFHGHHWKHRSPPLQHLTVEGQLPNSQCTECQCTRDSYTSNQAIILEHHMYARDQIEHRSFYNELQGNGRGGVLHPYHANKPPDEPKMQFNEQFVMDRNAINYPFTRCNFYEQHQVPHNYEGRDDLPYVCHSMDPGCEMYPDQQAAGLGVYMQMHRLEANGKYRRSHVYSARAVHQMASGSPNTSRNVHCGISSGTSYETPANALPMNEPLYMGLMRSTRDGSPGYSSDRPDYQIPVNWDSQSISNKIFPINGSSSGTYDYYNEQCAKHLISKENQHPLNLEAVQHLLGQAYLGVCKEPVGKASSPLCAIGDKAGAAPLTCHRLQNNNVDLVKTFMDASNITEKPCKTNHAGTVEDHDTCSIFLKCNIIDNLNQDDSKPVIKEKYSLEFGYPGPNDPNEQHELQTEGPDFFTESINSVKTPVMKDAKEIKTKPQANTEINVLLDVSKNKSSLHDSFAADPADVGAHSDVEQQPISNIESSTAEIEALAKGLQTIKNADLEEIRELGSGTYGSVYHGKWKGSDVAIKRIKASCFAGRPSEREHLIADFWKEALMLSSLHHPNVVSFYGVVRDGPDGSLATVTEFMVNGSLKQFLQKKDRTIDRRKRLIIAMDVAFGMEYLHGKQIVHFDLKCENLLVNMRDPHRPVCKIGDLGLSKVKQKTLVSGGVRGTLPWMAPELLNAKSNMVNEKVDVYSFGIAMWELLTGEEPYADMHCASIIGGIVNNTLRPGIPTWCDPEWRALTESCWSSDPGDRPSFSEISHKLRKMAAAINLK